MNKNEAKEIINLTFSNDFDEERYQKFVSNLFKHYKLVNRITTGSFIKQSFIPFVTEYKVLGSFEDSESNTIDILEVSLRKTSTLEQARLAQRNFIAEYLKSRSKDAALVAFISPDSTDWRLSFVKLEHSLEVIDEKLKTKEEITPAKRWSFLVGKNEGSHTAQSRFVNLLMSNQEPNLAEIESAFDIETVTKEFFNKYVDLFFRLKENLDSLLEKDEIIKRDFEAKEISTVDFAKKTLGQIIFLYFLQKKGWFGVAPDQKWGDGPKKFLRELFERRRKYGNNFFNNILEPLFYEALAQDRGSESIYPRLNNCRMPFLNGGLFEPMNGYLWETTDIIIPDELFSNNNRTKEGDLGDGILDVFDRYNFTVNENEPLEKEVAVDPEMLGKVFENLLDIKDRKSKGAFYTPREIVHYMCQESLINYLDTETKNEISREDLELFIKKGDRIIENDKIGLDRKEERINKYGSDKYKDSTYVLLLPETVRVRADKLDSLLKNIKVADPAVGSGAFPLGMINEIVRARKVLNVYIQNNTSDYELKKHTITNSIYGVDIDQGAVDIAKLRLWLALIVDEETPHPLPNLDHKIMQGNSLISEYEGIKLFDDSILEGSQQQEREKLKATMNRKLSLLQKEYFDLLSEKKLTVFKKTEIEKEIKSLKKRLEDTSQKKEIQNTNIGLFDIPNKKYMLTKKAELLQGKIEEFINESQRSKKQSLREDIDNLKWELIEATLKEQGKENKLDEIQQFRRKNIKPFFIWKLEFSDVFREKGGFDIIIANPPYVGESGNKEIFRPIAKGNLRKFYQGKMDLFYFFFHLALDLGHRKAKCAFITTNYFLTAFGARKLRKDLQERATIYDLINFNELKIFESALGQHNIITIFSKEKNLERQANTTLTKNKGVAIEKVLADIVERRDTNTEYNFVSQDNLYDGVESYIRLQGNSNQKDPIHIILNKIQNAGDLLSSFCNINQGVVSGCDYITKKHFKNINADADIKLNDGIFVFNLDNHRDREAVASFNEIERRLLRPFYKNSDIYRFYSSSKHTKLLLYHNCNLETSPYQNIFKYIFKFSDILKLRLINYKENYHWTKLHRTREESIFIGNKIVVPYRCKINTFAMNSLEWFCRSDCYVITEKNNECDLRYILALLNSSLYFQWLYHRGKRKGEILELFQTPLSEIPIKKITHHAQKPFIDFVEQIFDETSKDDYDPNKPSIKQQELENEIDKLVMDLYELTDEEKDIIRRACK